MRYRCDPHSLAKIAERVRGVELVELSLVRVEQAPAEVGLRQSRRELEHLKLEHLRRPDADRPIRIDEPLDRGKPRVASRHGCDGDLTGGARDLARVREAVRDGRDVECLECGAIGAEEALDVGRQRNDASRATVRPLQPRE